MKLLIVPFQAILCKIYVPLLLLGWKRTYDDHLFRILMFPLLHLCFMIEQQKLLYIPEVMLRPKKTMHSKVDLMVWSPNLYHVAYDSELLLPALPDGLMPRTPDIERY